MNKRANKLPFAPTQKGRNNEQEEEIEANPLFAKRRYLKTEIGRTTSTSCFDVLKYLNKMEKIDMKEEEAPPGIINSKPLESKPGNIPKQLEEKNPKNSSKVLRTTKHIYSSSQNGVSMSEESQGNQTKHSKNNKSYKPSLNSSKANFNFAASLIKKEIITTKKEKELEAVAEVRPMKKVKAFKETKEMKVTKGQKETQETREANETRETKVTKENKETREAKEVKPPKDIKKLTQREERPTREGREQPPKNISTIGRDDRFNNLNSEKIREISKSPLRDKILKNRYLKEGIREDSSSKNYINRISYIASSKSVDFRDLANNYTNNKITETTAKTTNLNTVNKEKDTIQDKESKDEEEVIISDLESFENDPENEDTEQESTQVKDYSLNNNNHHLEQELKQNLKQDLKPNLKQDIKQNMNITQDLKESLKKKEIKQNPKPDLKQNFEKADFFMNTMKEIKPNILKKNTKTYQENTHKPKVENKLKTEYYSDLYNKNGHINYKDTASTASTTLTSLSATEEKSRLKAKSLKSLPDIEKNKYYINLEDVMILEEYLSEILINLKQNSPVYNYCYDWWNFYNYSALFGTYQNFFKEELSKEVIHQASILELISIILCYYASSNVELFKALSELLNPLIYLIHQNYLILCDYIISKVAPECLSNSWVGKVMDVILKKIYCTIKKGENFKYIHENNKSIYNYLKSILQNYDSCEKLRGLKQMLATIKTLKLENLNEFFRNKILIHANFNSSVLAVIQDNVDVPIKLEIPYMKFTPKKSCTLVLDLDETLINFRLDKTIDNKGILRIRPGLPKFLKEMKNLFELVIFTASTQDYADPILDAIEGKNHFFEYRLYRHHCRILGGCFVKDLSYVGRDIKRTIIVDNMPQNFKLQKANGIFIKSFFGEEQDDTALLDLIPILKTIAQSNADVRLMLEKFKSQIFKTISSNYGKIEEEEE